MVTKDIIISAEFFNWNASNPTRSDEFNFGNYIIFKNFKYQAIQWLRYGRFAERHLEVSVKFYDGLSKHPVRSFAIDFANKVENPKMHIESRDWLSEAVGNTVVMEVVSQNNTRDYKIKLKSLRVSPKDSNSDFSPAPILVITNII